MYLVGANLISFFRKVKPFLENEIFNIIDHLVGNGRVFFSDMNKDGIVEVAQNGNPNELLQQEHYYPFGMGIKGEWKFVQPQIGGVNLEQYNGIELNDDFGLNWNMAMFRTYDPSIGRWGQIDPLAQKYLTMSPYNGMGNNPIRIADPMGDSLYPIIYTENNKRGDDMLKAAALTKKFDIEKGSNFDKERDKVVLIPVANLSRIKNRIDEAVKDYSQQYGKTSEVNIFSHAGLDGPIGTNLTDVGEDLERYQMTIEGWGEGISRCYFYGGNTANEGAQTAFITKISGLNNFKGVTIWGQPTSAYPSSRTYKRELSYYHYKDKFLYGGGIRVDGGCQVNIRKAYMVSGVYGEQWGILGFGTAHKMKASRDGKRVPKMDQYQSGKKINNEKININNHLLLFLMLLFV